MKRYAVVLNAMSNAKRLQVLTELLSQEKTVTELAGRVGLSQSSLSQHLSKLRAANLVVTRRDAQNVYYSVSSPVVRDVLGALHGTFGRPVVSRSVSKEH